MRTKTITALSALLATSALAQTSGTTRTVQQDFEAAAALDAGTDKAAALAAWEALDRRTVANRRSHAIVLVRKSAALLAMNRNDEAVAAARAGLAALPTTDPTLADDRYQAWRNLGRIAAGSLDYASAGAAFAEAEKAAVEPTAKLIALLGEVRTLTFTDPDAAMAASARADALLATTKLDAATRSYFTDARGVLLLNRKDLRGARDAAIEAVRLRGGLTERTSLEDVSARSNAAIALLLSGQKDEARRYMAMSGAGRVTNGAFDPAAEMTPPACGGEANLRPDDVAVVEFSVGSDGTVSSATPIYAAGGGAVALAFARAARDWSWTPEQVAAMPAFFRYNARVELRCNAAFERPSIASGLRGDLSAWLATRGQTLPDREGGDAASAPRQRAALAAIDAKGAGSTPAALVPIAQLVDNAVVTREETSALALRGLAIARANGAPPTAQLALDVKARLAGIADSWRRDVRRRSFDALLAEPGYAADPAARNALRLFIADTREGKTREVLDQVVDDKALAANDPLRVGALIRIASLEQQAGNAAAARAAFERSGLAASQCALIDNEPRQLKVGGSFPQEARIWGFEGWSRMQYDIGADGKVARARAIVSYPPFVFTDAATDTVRTAVYTKTYRPDGGIGCGAKTGNVRFRLER